jgi:hypothetical protein
VKFFITRQSTFDSLTFDPLDPGTFTQRVMDVSSSPTLATRTCVPSSRAAAA